MLNAALALETFSDDWDTEGPTVVDLLPLRGLVDTDYLVARPGTWAGHDEAGIVATLRADLTGTSSELTAVVL